MADQTGQPTPEELIRQKLTQMLAQKFGQSAQGGGAVPAPGGPVPGTGAAANAGNDSAKPVAPTITNAPAQEKSREPFIGDKNWDQYSKWEYDKDVLQKQHPEMTEQDAEHILTSRHGQEVATEAKPYQSDEDYAKTHPGAPTMPGEFKKPGALSRLAHGLAFGAMGFGQPEVGAKAEEEWAQGLNKEEAEAGKLRREFPTTLHKWRQDEEMGAADLAEKQATTAEAQKRTEQIGKPVPKEETAFERAQRDQYDALSGANPNPAQAEVAGNVVTKMYLAAHGAEYAEAMAKFLPEIAGPLGGLPTNNVYKGVPYPDIPTAQEAFYKDYAKDKATAETTKVGTDEKARVAANPKDTTDRTLARADRSYQFNSAQLEKERQPIDALMAKISAATTNINLKSPEADALLAPQILSLSAGGIGSGLRMNESEIKRILGGATKWTELQASINKWSTDPKHPQIPEAQREQMLQIVQAAQEKGIRKQQVIEETEGKLVDSDDPREHRQIIVEAHKALDAIDQGKAAQAAAPAKGAKSKGNWNPQTGRYE